MKISVFSFHVDPTKEKAFRDLVANYLKRYFPIAEEKATLTLSNHRLVVATYDYEWLWSEFSCFVDCVLRAASEKDILVVCESVNF